MILREITSRSELEQAWALRHDVFVIEQGVPLEVEVDEADTAATTGHVLGIEEDSGEVLGTGRLLHDEPGVVHLGRLAVVPAHRGRGLGHMLLQGLEELALARFAQDGAVRIILNAQQHATNFYARAGYELTCRPPFREAGIWHREMVRLRRADDTPPHVHSHPDSP